MKRHSLPVAVFPVLIVALLLATCTEDKRDHIFDPDAGGYYNPDSLEFVNQWAPGCNQNPKECLKTAHKKKNKIGNIFTLTIPKYDSSKKQITVSSPVMWLEGTLKSDKLDYFLVNAQPLEVTSKGTWKTILYLQEADNPIEFYARDTSGNTFSDTFFVHYDKSAPDTAGPIILVTTLESGDTVSTKFFLLTGLILDKSAIIDSEFTIAGQPVRVAGNHWSKNVQLKSGHNVLTLSAKDTKNNPTSFQFIIECRCNDSNSLDATADTDFVPPAIFQQEPEEGAPLATSDVVLKVEVTDPSGVASVEFLIGDSVQTLQQVEGGSVYMGRAKLNMRQTPYTIRARDKSFNKNDIEKLSQFILFTDHTPPTIKWEYPPEGQEVKTADIEVKITVSDDSSGIPPNDPTAVQIQVGGGAKENMDWAVPFYVKDVKLEVGENTILIFATDRSSNTGEDAFKITYRP